MTALERLRQAAELLPAGASVIVSREALLDALGGPVDAPKGPPAGDLTVAELSERFRRSPSTIRGWLEGGRFPGAYKLNRRDWRAPISAVEAFEDQQRGGHGQEDIDLSGWRRFQKRA